MSIEDFLNIAKPKMDNWTKQKSNPQQCKKYNRQQYIMPHCQSDPHTDPHKTEI